MKLAFVITAVDIILPNLSRHTTMDFPAEDFLSYAAVYAISIFKFVLGPVSGQAAGLPWYITATLTFAGMMTAVFIFGTLGHRIKDIYEKTVNKGKKSKTFTPQKRRIVGVWLKYGLVGVAFLTPILLTPIGGTLVATGFGESIRRIALYMSVSGIFWSIIISYFISEIIRLLPFLG